MYKLGQIVVQIGEGDLVLCSDGLTNDNLVDIIELVPIIILKHGLLEFVASFLFRNLSVSHYVYMANSLNCKNNISLSKPVFIFLLDLF